MKTLDQLLGGAMRLRIVRSFFDSDESFARGVLALLQCGDVQLFDAAGGEVPSWRWRALFVERQALQMLESFTLDVTEAGAKKVT